MIDTDEKLERLLPEIDGAPWIAVDTEADSLHSYPEKLCLIQVSIPGQDELIDPLAEIDLAPLWEVFKGRELIFHGADYDLRLFSKHHDFAPCKIFDTMIAARLLGIEAFGLATLVGNYLGQELEKGPQKSDWSKRPLTPRMEEYARNDTRVLRALSEHLRERLVDKGRLPWLEECCAVLISDNSKVVPPDPDRVWRIKYSSKLSPPALAVLRDVWGWREEEAKNSNKPPFFIMSHQQLVGLADAAGHGESFDRMIPRRYSSRRRRALMAAIEKGRGVPPDERPKLIRGQGYRASEAEKSAFAKLKAKRDAKAKELEIDPTLIASKDTLEQLTRNDSDGVWDRLMSWQRDLLS
ncbi:MAG: ribonuclease D [Limisphaerales bacterium]